MSGRPPLHGYNTNYRKSGVVYHVQTEDLGHPLCALVTQVFTGGTILAKKRTEYKDILDEEDLESHLRELMQKQHKELLIALREGSIDTSSISSVEEKVAKKGAVKPPTPPPTAPLKDRMRDTVQMELPPEFYEEIVESDSDEDGLIIEDFPPPETPIPLKKKANVEPPKAPATATPVPRDAPPPTIRMTPPSFPAVKLPPPVPQDARFARAAATESESTSKLPPPPPHKTKQESPSTAPPPRKPRIFAEISKPAPGLGGEGLGERSLDEVILSYLAEDLQDD
jgi:hypothetical protein